MESVNSFHFPLRQPLTPEVYLYDRPVTLHRDSRIRFRAGNSLPLRENLGTPSPSFPYKKLVYVVASIPSFSQTISTITPSAIQPAFEGTAFSRFISVTQDHKTRTKLGDVDRFPKKQYTALYVNRDGAFLLKKYSLFVRVQHHFPVNVPCSCRS